MPLCHRSKESRYASNKKQTQTNAALYAKDNHYDRLELATKIFIPSYVSFATVLRASGIIFQHYETIFVASYQTKEIVVDKQTFNFRTLKDPIFTNNLGIEIMDHYSIASPERAFLDVLYLNKDYHFDHLGSLNWDKIEDLLPIYGKNKRMRKLINRFREEQ